LHESASRLWLGPPKTPASARTITLPPFLVTLLRDYLEVAPGPFVFTSPLGCRLRRRTFDRRVFRPAVDGDDRHGLHPVRPGPTFHGLRHSHKTWLIADDIPEIAQARRLEHARSPELMINRSTQAHAGKRGGEAARGGFGGLGPQNYDGRPGEVAKQLSRIGRRTWT
jgi:integrase